MMLNRLQTYWKPMKVKILRHWDQLTASDLVAVDGRFDRLIEVIRSRYKPGRSPISIEAKIYDWLLTELGTLEREEAKKKG